MLKRVCAFLAAVYLFFLPLLALAECAHANVDHFCTTYTNLGVNVGHSSMTQCRCLDCNTNIVCHPHSLPTPTTPHSWKNKTPSYTSNGVDSHTRAQPRSCVCGANDTLTIVEAHSYQLVGNYHGVGDEHINVYQCSDCGQNKTESYYCPGNNCVVINGWLDESVE